jgi:DNA repair exonuclease SbcCD ATPase subunit
MNALNQLLKKSLLDMSPAEHALFILWMNALDESEETRLVQQELAADAATELAALREQVRAGDKRILQLMDEIEMREGESAARWAMLRDILKGGTS